jgi:hypothetical protein
MQDDAFFARRFSNLAHAHRRHQELAELTPLVAEAIDRAGRFAAFMRMFLRGRADMSPLKTGLLALAIKTLAQPHGMSMECENHSPIMMFLPLPHYPSESSTRHAQPKECLR